MAIVAVDWQPKPRQLRQFALLGGAFCLVLAALLWRREADRAAVSVLLAMGLGIGVLGALWPETVRHLYLAAVALTWPIGWVVGHGLLAVVYFGLLTPLGLYFKLVGRDALQRRPDRRAKTYWQPRPAAPPPERYLRQY